MSEMKTLRPKGKKRDAAWAILGWLGIMAAVGAYGSAGIHFNRQLRIETEAFRDETVSQMQALEDRIGQYDRERAEGDFRQYRWSREDLMLQYCPSEDRCIPIPPRLLRYAQGLQEREYRSIEQPIAVPTEDLVEDGEDTDRYLEPGDDPDDYPFDVEGNDPYDDATEDQLRSDEAYEQWLRSLEERAVDE